jgi:hypothetical protein
VEDLAVFASQLEGWGLRAVVHVRSVPEGLSRNVQFDLAPRLRDQPPAPDDRLVILAAERLEDHKLVAWRRLAGDGPRPCIAFGRFANRQSVVATTAKLSYVLGRDPEIVDLNTIGSVAGDVGPSAPVFGVPRRGRADVARPRLLVVGPDLGDGRHVAGLEALAVSRTLSAAVLTDGQSKADRLAVHGVGPPFYHYGEILPASLAERVDVCALFVPLQKNYRLHCLVANLAVAGATLLDCTRDHGIAATSDAFLRGPSEPAALMPFLTTDILPNRRALGEHVRTSTAAARCAGRELRARLAAADGDAHTTAPAEPSTGERRPVAAPVAKLVIMPTNGVGLGHAQRCVLVADELDRTRLTPVFAVFPSCSRLVENYGFDAMPLIARSALHAESHANDVPNYLRLRALARDAAALVFDGGYVFDSVYRTILEHRLRAVWIRRGLWQAQQDNTTSLDREKAFERVVVPGEAFDELNVAYSHGDHVHVVGPIVRRDPLDDERRGLLRARLAERYGLDFDRLVVTQLGGGVAADRGAQIQAICGVLERRADVLHLVLAWPTAVLEPGWFRWGRTRVVKTHHAGVLAAAADLCITAAGYNAFHEVLYNARVAIFVPQTGTFMDDQRARALAAHERGLAGFLEPHQLMTLQREITRLLDDAARAAVRRRLEALDLPAPGNARAARLVSELTDADAPLERPARPHRARRGG